MKTRSISAFKYSFRAPGSQVEGPIRFALGRTVLGTILVGRSQRTGYLHGYFQRSIQCRAFTAKVSAQRLTLDKLLRNEMKGTLVSDFMNGDDVGMIERRSSPASCSKRRNRSVSWVK